MSALSLVKHIEDLLHDLAPTLGLHSGGVELVDITSENVVRVRFSGACVGCHAAAQTLEYGIKQYLMLRATEITDVISIDDDIALADTPLSYAHYPQS